VLAAEVLAMATTGIAPAQEALRTTCLLLLARLAQQRQQRRAGGGQQRGPAAAAADHVFVAAAGTKLMQLLAGGPRATPLAVAQALHLLERVGEYVEAVAAPAAAAAVAAHCLVAARAAFGILHAAGPAPAEWPPATWELLHSLLALLRPACAHCGDPAAGRALLGVCLGDYKAATMLMAAAEALLLGPAAGGGRRGGVHALPRLPTLQRHLLTFFSALAGLVARQAAVPGGGAPGLDPGSDILLAPSSAAAAAPSRRLTRRHALNFFSFLVAPRNGFARRVLEQDEEGGGGGGDAPAAPAPASVAATRLRQALLELLRALFAAPGSPYAGDKPCSDFYVRFHFIQFLRLYHNPDRDHQAVFLARQHMAALLALAGAGGPAAPHLRQRFQQLSVVDFFVRELSLELEASREGAGAPPRRDSSSAGSAAEIAALSPAAPAGEPPAPGSAPASPEATPRGLAALGKARHRRAQSHSSISAVGRLLQEGPARKIGSAGSKGSLGSLGSLGSGPAVPKLRLGASFGGDEDSDAAAPGSPGSPGSAPRRRAPDLPPPARAGSLRTPSRLGRDAPAAGGEPEGGLTRRLGAPLVPKLGLAGLGMTEPAGPTAPPDFPGFDDEPRVHASPAGPAHAAPPPEAGAAGEGEGPPKRLVSMVSAAISLDCDWPLSTRGDGDGDGDGDGQAGGDGDGDGAAAAAPTPARMAGFPASMLPKGFVFSGDLDEDVEMLEALELEEVRTSCGSCKHARHKQRRPCPPPPPRVRLHAACCRCPCAHHLPRSSVFRAAGLRL
jgi:hypothetical protein